MRRTANTSPRHAPCFSSASMAYCEHVGEYLQTDGSNGPRKSWYARTSAIRTERTVAPVSAHQPTERTADFRAQVCELHCIRAGSRPDDDVQSAFGWKHILANDFPQATLEPVAIHRRLSMARYNDTNSRKAERGSARPDREVPGSYDFPLLLNTPDVSAATDALRPRIPQARLTLRRTWTEALPSGASAPSCGDG
jgi:hypothetical protein